ncbi:MAG: UDP-N-acetylmuramoyl-tripeptide--D-alanyl-D-alanine ligase [Bacteroidales bacterium]|jgi:UDP-N-acetylmuramoyl-tripeptide--D-alanyl-D-alanine ligase|nr:UDP-N-acetylmuramoyl-tripeptide--D-alanyl-D-alanine ligase [Bacteroidales bacterium]
MVKHYQSESKQIESLYKIYLNNPHITTDSRKVQQGDIFFALRGDNFDGNQFAKGALEMGACCVVMDNENLVPQDYKDRCFIVEDVFKTLDALAIFHRLQLKIPVIGITGTNGKTTTKELLMSILSRKYKTQATKGNFNNHIGVPLTLLSVTDQYEMAIVEMGANHCGEIGYLCQRAMPTHGLITNIGHAHIEGFGSFDGVVKTKCELLDYLEQHNGFAFVNLDDTNVANRAAKLTNKTTYSIKQQADIVAQVDDTKPQASLTFNGMEITSNLTGAFNAQNILAAVSVGKHFGLSDAEIKDAITNYYPENHRSQIKQTKHNTLILDCYNANPSSVKASVEAFIKMTASNKRVYLGAMKELGSDSWQEHKAVLNLVNGNGFEQIAFVGGEYKELCQGNDNLLWFSTSLLLREYLLANPVKDSTILIKGSRATQMELVEDVL